MIQFCSEDIKFNLPHKNKHKAWLKAVAAEENKSIGEINYVFCSDDYLLEINKQFLNHDTLTDIVTFDHSENDHLLEGDIFISYERVLENGKNLATEASELQRVMVHGLLHLAGYKDKKRDDKEIMTAKEDYYLTQYFKD
ncbi:rRNA maturation RNase YbeY [Aquirufa rosea]|uniref:Endoribonuclease YbeY n=1 Tax=Aquirufa rosea TaxID=2509241 RepID=A0A4Q1BZ85_9BACT|nr:rRNA maturation RNase YbeY [Aquirufa rosea]RXK48872.1 rRNA maturation RNase YbeY [Aquirufa rosea]